MISARKLLRPGVCGLLLVVTSACIRGKLPAREFYRLAPTPATAADPTAVPPLAGSMFIASYKTPGIYGGGSIVYRVGASTYGAYPSREWAIPLGEMLGALTADAVRQRGLTSGEVAFDASATRREQYEWRGSVREFDEVDAPNSVSAAVSLSAQLIRATDDSVVWSGSVTTREPVVEQRRMESVVAALSLAASRAIAQLADDAAASLRSRAASGARTR